MQTTYPAEKQFVSLTVDGQHKKMAYVEIGEGDKTIVFLHGNPTSSYLWRNVMPKVEQLGRCLAPDLIGQGDSDKLDNPNEASYSFDAHYAWLSAFLKKMTSGKIFLVLHDWGCGLGLHWANNHRDRVAGIAHMEGLVNPVEDWHEWSEAATPIFQAMRSEAGEEMVLDKNIFVERILPGSILRDLRPEEMEEYRRPFSKKEDRWPTLAWPRQIPIAGRPENVNQYAKDWHEWMCVNDLPKLFVNAEPGAIVVGAVRDRIRTWSHQDEITVKGSHFIQEDSGPEIGEAVAEWIKRIDS